MTYNTMKMIKDLLNSPDVTPSMKEQGTKLLASKLQDETSILNFLHQQFIIGTEKSQLISGHLLKLFDPKAYVLKKHQSPGDAKIDKEYFGHVNCKFDGLFNLLNAISGSGIMPSHILGGLVSDSYHVSPENLCGLGYSPKEVAKITMDRIISKIRRDCGLSPSVAVGSERWNKKFRMFRDRRNCKISLQASFNSEQHNLAFYQNIGDLCCISLDDIFAAQGESNLTPDDLFTAQ